MLTLLLATAFAVIRLRGLLTVTMVLGIYSFLSASLLMALDAVDVAMTEAAVGAGITTVLLLLAIALTGPDEEESVRSHLRDRILPLAVVVATGGALIYGTLDMPDFGALDVPAHEHVAPRYLERTDDEIGIPNVVTAVLASYRGYDTLGEVTVIFTAAIGVLLLLGVQRHGRERPPSRAHYETERDEV